MTTKQHESLKQTLIEQILGSVNNWTIIQESDVLYMRPLPTEEDLKMWDVLEARLKDG